MATAELPRDDLTKMIRAMQADIDLLKRQSPLANTGLSVTGTGEVVVLGGIESSNYVAGTSGWRFDGETLEANTGVIGDGALANPILFASPRADATGFDLATAYATLASVDVTVPTGFTQLQMSVQVRMYAVNAHTSGGLDGTGTDAIYVRAQVGALLSKATPTGISGSGGFATTYGSDSFTLTGLTPGDLVTLAVEGRVNSVAFVADVTNYASVSAALAWSR